jgi:Glycosyltransferase family 87
MAATAPGTGVAHPAAAEEPGRPSRSGRGVARLAGGLAPILPALVAGLVLRYLLAPFTAWPHDDAVWYQAAAGGQHNLGLYARSEFPYPPLWGLMLSGLGQVLGHLGVTGGTLGGSDPSFAALDQSTHTFAAIITGPWFNLAFKTVLFGFDLGTGLLLRGLVGELTGNPRRGNLAFALWFLNPLVLFESAVFGGFDVMVGFFVLAALVLVLHRRHAWAGVALALGVLTKVSPVALLPLLLLVVADPQREGGRLRLQVVDTVRLAAGFVAGLAAVGLPVLLAGDAALAVHGTVARTQTDLAVGGLSLFGLRSFRGLDWIPGWVQDHAGAVSGGATLVWVAAAVGIALLARRWVRRDRAFGLLGGATAILAVLLLTQPLTQPQYVLWLLPTLLVLAAAWRIGAWQAAVLSVTPLVFVYSLFGPLAVLAPLARSTGVISPDGLAARSLAWFNQGTGLWGVDRGSDFRSVATVLTVAALVAVLASIPRAAPRDPLRSLHRRAGPVTRPLLAMGLVAAVLAAGVAGAAATYRPGFSASPAALQVRSATSTGLAVDLRLDLGAGPGQDAARILAFPVAHLSPDRRVEVFVDPSYPGPDSDRRSVLGVYDHLSAELRVHGDGRRVEAVDAGELTQVLGDLASAPATAVVMTAGVMPAGIFSRHADLVTPWLRAGGQLLWCGDAIGYYSEDPTATFDRTAAPSLRDAGPDRIVGSGVIQLGKAQGRTASAPTTVASALGLRFDSTAIGVNLDAVAGAGGSALGYVGDNLSSLTALPVGAGQVVLMSGDSYDEELISHDLWLLLMSHVTDRTGSVAYQDAGAGGTLSWQAATSVGPRESLVVESFDPDPAGVSFSRQIVTLGAIAQ